MVVRKRHRPLGEDERTGAVATRHPQNTAALCRCAGKRDLRRGTVSIGRHK
jgi:hypothetical protein